MVRDAEVTFIDLCSLVPGAVGGDSERWREGNRGIQNSADFLSWNNEPDVEAV